MVLITVGLCFLVWWLLCPLERLAWTGKMVRETGALTIVQQAEGKAEASDTGGCDPSKISSPPKSPPPQILYLLGALFGNQI